MYTTAGMYRKYAHMIPAMLPNLYYFELRTTDMYPFPPRHPDTSVLLCLWHEIKTSAGPQTQQTTYSINKNGYRIVDSFPSMTEEGVDKWLSYFRTHVVV